jgi:hypothetical protein
LIVWFVVVRLAPVRNWSSSAAGNWSTWHGVLSLRKCSGASRVNLATRRGYTALDAPCALALTPLLSLPSGPVLGPPFWTTFKPASTSSFKLT